MKFFTLHVGALPEGAFYCYQQGGSVFTFRIEDGCLRASITREGKTENAVLIHGVPQEWRCGLDDTEKATKVQQALCESFFSYQGRTVTVNPRGLGGWNDPQHRGYAEQGKKKGAMVAALVGAAEGFVVAGIPGSLLKGYLEHEKVGELFDPNRQSYSLMDGGKGAQGSFLWAMETGFVGRRNLMPAYLSYHDYKVDYGKTSPFVFSHVPQGWHFNTKRGTVDGSKEDSRMVHVFDNLLKAVKLRQMGNITKAMAALGRGLHPLQDVFAHTNDFVSEIRVDLDIANFGFRWHGMTGHADEPYYIPDINSDRSPRTVLDEPEFNGKAFNQRYSDTKTATYIYLLLFRLATEPSFLNSGKYYRIANQLNIVQRFNSRNQKFATIPLLLSEFRRRLQQDGLEVIPEDVVLFARGPTPFLVPTSVAAVQQERSSFFELMTKTVEALKRDINVYMTKAYVCCKKPIHKGVAELPNMRAFSDAAMEQIMQCQTIISAERRHTAEQSSTRAADNGQAMFFTEIRATMQALRQDMMTYKVRADGCRRSHVGELPDMRSYSASAVVKIDQLISHFETHTLAGIRAEMTLIGQDVATCKTRAIDCRRSHVGELPDMRLYAAKAATGVEQCLAVFASEEQRVAKLATAAAAPMSCATLCQETSAFIATLQDSIDMVGSTAEKLCATAYECCKTDMAELLDMRLVSDSIMITLNQCRSVVAEESRRMGLVPAAVYVDRAAAAVEAPPQLPAVERCGVVNFSLGSAILTLEHVRLIANMIRDSQSLQTLSISSASLNAEMISTLLQAVDENDTLLVLCLDGLTLTVDHVRLLVSVIEESLLISSISFNGVSLADPNQWDLLLRAIERNNTLASLDLTECALSVAQKVSLQAILEQKTSLQLIGLPDVTNARLLLAAVKSDSAAVMRAVLDGATLDAVDCNRTSNGWSALHWFAKNGNYLETEVALGSEVICASINKPTADSHVAGLFGFSGRHTALHIVSYVATYSRERKIAMMQLLLSAGADANLLDSSGRKALPDELRQFFTGHHDAAAPALQP